MKHFRKWPRLFSHSRSHHCSGQVTSLNGVECHFLCSVVSVISIPLHYICPSLGPPQPPFSHCTLGAFHPLHLSLISTALLCPSLGCTVLTCNITNEPHVTQATCHTSVFSHLVSWQNFLQLTHSPFLLDFYNYINPYLIVQWTLYLITQISLLYTVFSMTQQVLEQRTS